MTLREKIEFKNALLFLSPWIIGFMVFVAYPIVAAIGLSFTDYSVLSAPRWIGLHNYKELFHDERAISAIIRTLGFALVSLPLGLFTSLMLALLLEKPCRGIGIYRTAIFLPSLVPQVAVATLALWIFATDGIFNSVFDAIGLYKILGIKPIVWMCKQNVLPTLLIISLWGVGNSMIIFIAGLHQVPAALYESAELDGAGYFRRVRHISVPMISPVIFFNFIIGLIAALSQFTIPFFIKGSSIRIELGDSVNFLSLEINTQALSNLRMGYASALSVILLIFVMILTFCIFKGSKKLVHYGENA